jgi:N-acetylmuramoyl-L-alanine amidase
MGGGTLDFYFEQGGAEAVRRLCNSFCTILRNAARIILCTAALACTAIWPGAVWAAPGGASEATSAAVKIEAEATTFELVLSAGVPAEIFTLASPYRVIIDLPDVTFKLASATEKQAVGLVSAFRYGLFAEGKARVVIDTTGPVKIKSAGMTRVDKGVLLKLALVATDTASFGSGTGATRHSPSDSKSAAATDVPVIPSTRGKPSIVIDAGHGGIDPGAVSPSQVAEKSIVLAVAQQLKTLLMQTGRFDVFMTRTSDVFVSLDHRLKYSSDHQADLFISLHADSIEERNVAESIRGATIYTLSERASDEQARIMAEKENASDLIAGLETGSGAAHEQVKSILIDLLKRETANFSADFSNVLAAKLGKSIVMARDSQRSAAFKVLKQPHAPSVLVELGYMSNSKDQEQMTSAVWQKQVATSIAAAAQAYFSKRTAEHP